MTMAWFRSRRSTLGRGGGNFDDFLGHFIGFEETIRLDSNKKGHTENFPPRFPRRQFGPRLEHLFVLGQFMLCLVLYIIMRRDSTHHQFREKVHLPSKSRLLAFGSSLNGREFLSRSYLLCRGGARLIGTGGDFSSETSGSVDFVSTLWWVDTIRS